MTPQVGLGHEGSQMANRTPWFYVLEAGLPDTPSFIFQSLFFFFQSTFENLGHLNKEGQAEPSQGNCRPQFVGLGTGDLALSLPVELLGIGVSGEGDTGQRERECLGLEGSGIPGCP